MNPRLLLVAPLLVLGLAACGDDDEARSGDDEFCIVAQELDAGAFEAFTAAETPEEVEAAVNDVVDQLNRAEDVAPDEIKDSITTLSDVYEEIASGLAAVDYDLETYFASEEAAAAVNGIDEDTFNELELYLEDECGISTAN